MGIRFAPLAMADLEGIGDFIARDNPSRAYSFVRELRKQCGKISDSPLRHRAKSYARIWCISQG
jgi:toxin ParE1/3/4